MNFKESGLPDHPLVRAAFDVALRNDILNQGEAGIFEAREMIANGFSSDPEILAATILRYKMFLTKAEADDHIEQRRRDLEELEGLRGKIDENTRQSHIAQQHELLGTITRVLDEADKARAVLPPRVVDIQAEVYSATCINSKTQSTESQVIVGAGLYRDLERWNECFKDLKKEDLDLKDNPGNALVFLHNFDGLEQAYNNAVSSAGSLPAYEHGDVLREKMQQALGKAKPLVELGRHIIYGEDLPQPPPAKKPQAPGL